LFLIGLLIAFTMVAYAGEQTEHYKGSAEAGQGALKTKEMGGNPLITINVGDTVNYKQEEVGEPKIRATRSEHVANVTTSGAASHKAVLQGVGENK